MADTEIFDASILLLQIVQKLVDHPEQVSVEAEAVEDRTTIRLRVAQEDLGKVIGKEGRTVRSLRTVLSCIGARFKHRYMLDIR
jgi:predicted RNA-binding protein YlqC (UPF0109 family)